MIIVLDGWTVSWRDQIACLMHPDVMHVSLVARLKDKASVAFGVDRKTFDGDVDKPLLEMPAEPCTVFTAHMSGMFQCYFRSIGSDRYWTPRGLVALTECLSMIVRPCVRTIELFYAIDPDENVVITDIQSLEELNLLRCKFGKSVVVGRIDPHGLPDDERVGVPVVDYFDFVVGAGPGTDALRATASEILITAARMVSA